MTLLQRTSTSQQYEFQMWALLNRRNWFDYKLHFKSHDYVIFIWQSVINNQRNMFAVPSQVISLAFWCYPVLWTWCSPLTLQIYAEMIGNVMTDARSTGKYYHCKFTDSETYHFGKFYYRSRIYSFSALS